MRATYALMPGIAIGMNRRMLTITANVTATAPITAIAMTSLRVCR